jgi:uncharacterized membrane protein YqjE
MHAAAGGRHDPQEDSRSIADLARRLMTQTSELARKEIELARVELAEAMDVLRSAAISSVVGATVTFGGFLMLLAAAALGLDELLHRPWLSALAVGLGCCVAGGVLVLAARRRLGSDALVPDKSAESLRRDRKLVQRDGRWRDARKEIAWNPDEK